MFGDSFIAFLKEEQGKADRQKVMALSALVGSSVLAQMMFAGVAQSEPGCGFQIRCDQLCPSTCVPSTCDAVLLKWCN